MTTGSMSLRIFDVFYIEQYLAAALLMPLVLDSSLDTQEQQQRQKRANRFRYGLLVIFWSYLVGWYIYSCVNGNLFSRQLVYVLDCYNISIVFYSLISIKRQLARLETSTTSGLLANQRLLNYYIGVNLLMLLASMMQLFFLLFRYNFQEDRFRQADKSCNTYLIVTIIYNLIWPLTLLHISFSCYLSIKQTRSIQECNEEFSAVLTDNVQNLRRQSEKAYRDRVEREKVERRLRFYREYANN